jgi:hypothetical protein
MNTKTILSLLLITASTAYAQHGHLNVGAAGKNQGDPLNFNNGMDFIAASGYVKTLDYSASGKYSNYFNGSITLTAMHSVNGLGEPVPGSAAPGSLIEVQLIQVAGPSGGKFALWDDAISTNAPAFAVPAGTTDGTNRFMLSDTALGAGLPGADPFGHLHGRRFSADRAGVYKVGFKAHDISTNGTGGGPIHAPSAILDVFFQAGYNLTGLTRTGTTATVTAGTATNFLFTLQANPNLTEAGGWTNVATLNGTDYFETFMDTNAGSARRFYRLSIEPVSP